MKLTPVKSYRTDYPNQYEVDLKPLLLSTKPKSWSGSTAALIMCALAVAGTTGCVGIAANPFGDVAVQAVSENMDDAANQPEDNSATPGSENMDDAANQPEDNSATPGSRKMNIAPIFGGMKRNEGLSFGADVGFLPQISIISTSLSSKDYSVIPLGNYPGFSTAMPETTALEIISEELAKSGLNTEATTKQVEVTGSNSKSTQWSFDLAVSGGKEPIYIEYVPSSDIETNGELQERTGAGLPETSLDAAYSLHDKLIDVYDESSAVIFYDNQMVMSPDETANLKAQVAEFVDWLKTMGLI
jgi:hypothetical protein